MFNRAFCLKAAFLLFALAAAPAFAQNHQPVLMISVDGMRPDYVTDADAHHLRIPILRRILAESAHASGVNGVLPTVTYPSHTTLVTGVWPAEHGILNNGRFDPERKFNGTWYWYADEIKVPTLWSAAHASGLRTASVSWPVTVDSADIDFDIPEYWRSAGPGDANNPDDRFLMGAVSRPDGELGRIAARLHKPYMNGNDTTLAGDEVRTAYSLDILKQHRPEFATIHLSSLDEEEHLHGPFSDEANADLEGIDAMIGRLVAQELANYPNAVVAIVSDHGFAPVEHAVNFAVPFLQAGLIQMGKSPAGNPIVTSWQAEPWAAGCVTPILLHDATDSAIHEKVKTLLNTLAADPGNGIEAVLDHQQAITLGGFPDAAFLVTLKVGYCNGGSLTGALVSTSPQKGAHGYNMATTPAMRSSFFVFGQHVARGKDLGLIDMRQIAPTLAQVLGVSLPSATKEALSIH
jgi:hypothetical protein